ncbi:MAG: MFS transporter [Kofleriaceae bacterium]
MSQPAPRQSAVRTALAGLIGNVLEWFDFAVFGFFAKTIGMHFMPDDDPTISALFGYLVLLVGFIARPAGSIVLGLVGDRIGRRALLTVSIALMGVATLGIGLLPAYDTIGVAAPILLIVFRLMQGFSLGGEFTGSMVYTTEHASPLMRGLVSSSTAAGTTLGFILGSFATYLVERGLGPVEAQAWGWRIPFIASITLCIAGWFLRKGIHESEAGEKAAGEAAIGKGVTAWLSEGIRAALRSLVVDWKPIVQTFGIVALTNAAYYLVFTFAVDQRKEVTNAVASDFQLVNTLSLFVVLFAKPLGGWLSDKMGRRRLMIILQIVAMAAVVPAVHIMKHGSTTTFMLGQILLAVPLGMALGLQGAMVVEIFPLRSRVTSMSIAYSITLAIAGGAAPLVSKWLIAELHDPLAPAYYALIYGVIGLVIMARMRETNTRSLNE